MFERPVASPSRDEAMLALIEHLRARGYGFVTPTPATHARILARRAGEAARDLRDVFGWSMAFGDGLLDEALFDLLRAAALVERDPHGWRSRVRVSSLGADLLVHSAFPTESRDAVFFGPDSYRFAALIHAELARCPHRAGATLVDIGTGTGAGAIAAARACPDLRLIATDINPAALDCARVNARAAGVTIATRCGETLAGVTGPIDIALANPPYIMDEDGRAYRDGGGLHGGQVSLDIATAAVARLAPGGRLILYTGSAIVRGDDALRARLAHLARTERCVLRYDEIDPDVFGEELETPAYRDVDRIALVSAVVERPA